MSTGKHHHHPQEGPHLAADHQDSIPYWKRAHRDWRFWVAVCFIFAALAIYVVTVDLSVFPRTLRQHPRVANQ
jgi:hypothetical protein